MAKRFVKYETENPVGVNSEGVLTGNGGGSLEPYAEYDFVLVGIRNSERVNVIRGDFASIDNKLKQGILPKMLFLIADNNYEGSLDPIDMYANNDLSNFSSFEIFSNYTGIMMGGNTPKRSISIFIRYGSDPLYITIEESSDHVYVGVEE